jgi:phosphatidylserine/phosphatidylglycerophosphate/cardiolipin synthase-like enzyme
MPKMNANADLYRQTLSYRKNSAPGQCLSQLWFVRVPKPLYYPRYRCLIEPLICGQELFGRIETDLLNARDSVDIITWGFDPGMVLVRGASAEEGMRYGDLLKMIATRKINPVKVRLLVWHDDAAAHAQMNNNPGYYGTRFPLLDRAFKDFYSESHQAYNDEWYKQVCADEIPNIHFHVRDVPAKFIKPSLSEETVPSTIMATLAKRYPTHHQKMVLIDYEFPKLAIGYVMGHNSITDFWDTKEHVFRDIHRERFYSMDHAKLQRKAWQQDVSESQRYNRENRAQSYIDANSHVSKPFQDVSCRVRGPILYDLNHNFCQAWEESKRPSGLFRELCWLAWLPGPRVAAKVIEKIGNALHHEMDEGFSARRKAIALGVFDLPNGRHNLQLLRTQPMHGEKTIKECYANLPRQMLHYIFIQNQYIQYQPWADHLIECSGRLRAANYLKPMYVFILTSTPESDGMDQPTYEVASKIGMSTTMPVEHDEAVSNGRKTGKLPPITAEELAAHGLNIFMGSLWTCADKDGKLRPTDYEEIYIHAKVAVVDDAALTIGSANLNLRSMALDSELNVISDAFDVAYKLRADLFVQCSQDPGPQQFGDMMKTFKKWKKGSSKNFEAKASGAKLVGQLLPFYVDRKPGTPVM